MNSLIDKIGYTGVLEMKLSAVNKDVRYKNSGTLDLFRSLCRFLTGETTSTLPIPAFIDIVNYAANSEESILVSPSPIVSAKITSSEENTQAQVDYLANINRYDIKQSTNLERAKIKLLDQTGKRALAEITIDEEMMSFEEMLMSLDPGVNMSLRWSLIFANSATSK